MIEVLILIGCMVGIWAVAYAVSGGSRDGMKDTKGWWEK